MTDVFGKFATKARVYVVKASPASDSKQVLIRNQEALPVSQSEAETLYSFNFLSTKPEPGTLHVILLRAVL